MLNDRLQAIVDEEARKTETESKADQGNDGDPFLPGILLVQPRPLDLTLLHSSRVEVFLVLHLMVHIDGRRRGISRTRT